MVKSWLMAGTMIGLAACAPVTDGPATGARPPAGECDATSVQRAIGQRATAQMGSRLLTETGATQLRWVPPRTAVTMDYRPDRLTVSYDDDYMIDRIACG